MKQPPQTGLLDGAKSLTPPDEAGSEKPSVPPNSSPEGPGAADSAAVGAPWWSRRPLMLLPPRISTAFSPPSGTFSGAGAGAKTIVDGSVMGALVSVGPDAPDCCERRRPTVLRTAWTTLDAPGIPRLGPGAGVGAKSRP